jgi:hypothetical protein
MTSKPDSFFRVMVPPAYRPAPSTLAAAFLARRQARPDVPARDVLAALRAKPLVPSYGAPSWFRRGQPVKVRQRGAEWSTKGDGSAFFREVRSAERVGWRDPGYYRATEWEDKDEGRHPKIARVRHGRDTWWIAGYEIPASEWSTWDIDSPYGDESEASRAAHDMARKAAEKEWEYQEGWQAGLAAREALAEALAEARNAIGKARIMREAARTALRRALAQREGEAAGFVPPDVLAEGRRLYREALMRSRELAEWACEVREEAWRKVRQDRPCRGRSATYESDPGPAGFWEGWQA